MRSEEEVEQALYELEELSASTSELIPHNVEAIRSTLSWVLEEDGELPEVIPE